MRVRKPAGGWTRETSLKSACACIGLGYRTARRWWDAGEVEPEADGLWSVEALYLWATKRARLVASVSPGRPAAEVERQAARASPAGLSSAAVGLARSSTVEAPAPRVAPPPGPALERPAAPSVEELATLSEYELRVAKLRGEVLKLEEQHRGLQLRNERDAARLVDWDEVSVEVAGALRYMAEQLDTLPRRVAGRLLTAATEAEARELLEEEVANLVGETRRRLARAEEVARDD